MVFPTPTIKLQKINVVKYINRNWSNVQLPDMNGKKKLRRAKNQTLAVL